MIFDEKDFKTAKLSLELPLEDPDNVDKRRATRGMLPLSEYVKTWEIDWNVEEYKKLLPKLEAK